MSSELRPILQDIISPLPGKLAVATSSGIDSASTLLAALDCNKEVSVISFTLADRQSKDFRTARGLARKFNLEFIPVFLPVLPEPVLRRVEEVIRVLRLPGSNFDLKLKKTTVDCLFPWIDTFEKLQEVKISTLLTGIGADGHFALSKEAYINYRETREKFQEYRRKCFNTPDYNQIISRAILSKQYGIDVICPYFDKRIFDLYAGKDWYEVNKPRQKEVVRREFPEVEGISNNVHQILQGGDSGISETIAKVVISELSPGSKSPLPGMNKLDKLAKAGKL
tara:strand:- start:12622 stop:13464 length:843 start_codon:yes stop_codon:yes gene_type:complete